VYVIEFEQGERYVGMTEDLDRRLGEHRRRQSPSTRRFHGEFLVCYRREFPSYSEARGHEKFLKSGAGRKLVDSVIRTKGASESESGVTT
jgi:predicted GIY-YIG superfamily endonuclease